MLLSERHNSSVRGIEEEEEEEEEDKTVTTRFISTNDKGKQSRQEKENTALLYGWIFWEGKSSCYNAFKRSVYV